MTRLAAILLGFAIPSALLAQESQGTVIPVLFGPSDEADDISVTVDPGLTSHKSLRSAVLRAARAAMHEGRPVSPEHLRALADAGDGLAAQRYVRILMTDADSANPSDIAYYAATAVGTGRVWTLKPMIAAMHRLDPATEPTARVRKYIQVLYPHAWAGNTAALRALVDFNGEGRLFGPLSDRTRQRILDQARATGDGRTELSLALGILEVQRASDIPDADALQQARDYLTLAQASAHLAVRTTAQNLLRLMENG